MTLEGPNIMNSVKYAHFESDYIPVMDGWEAKENEDGAIYFSNSHLKVTSWTHPYLDKIFEELKEFNEIQYAAYRTAMKLRHLQNKSGLSLISLRGIKKILASASEPEDSYRELNVKHREVFNIIHSILEVSENPCLHKSHLPKAADIIVNLLIELFDTNYDGKLSLSSLKISLATLCSAQLCEKYRFFFSEVFNPKEQILQRERLLYLFYDLMQIVEVLKESTAFGTNVSVAVDSCLKYQAATSGHRSSCEDSFYSWLLQEPQIIVWLPTLHRVISTENTFHNVQCSVCGINPLRGFRYRCLLCFKYDLCQECFFQGKTTSVHKLKHPIREYCLPASRQASTKALFQILRNKLSKKYRSQSKIPYLPLDDDSLTGSVFQWQPRHYRKSPKERFHESTDSGLASNLESCNKPSVELSLFKKKDDNHTQEMRIAEDSHGGSTSSQFTNDEQLSTKDMIDQESSMRKLIKRLQNENKYLHEKLELLSQERESASDSNYSLTSSNQSMRTETEQDTETRHHKIDQIDIINEISSSSSVETVCHCTVIADVKVDDDKANSDGENLPYMEIVGYCTPVRSSFCEKMYQLEPKEALKGESYSEENTEAAESGKLSSEYTVPKSNIDSRVEEGQEKIALDIEAMMLHKKDDDITSESTASGGIEYGYSDMSIHSDSVSHKITSGEKEMPVVIHISNGNEEAFKSPERSKDLDLNENMDATNEIKMINYENRKQLQGGNTVKNPQSNLFDLKPPQVEEKPSLSQTTELSTNELFYNISDILPDGSTLPALSNTSNKPLASGNDPFTGRQIALEPVFMSTPVVRAEGDSLECIGKQDKENRVLPLKKETPLQLIALYKCSDATKGATPKLTVSSKQNRRLMLSQENVSTDNKSASVDFGHKEIGMTTMFDKVEHQGILQSPAIGDSLTRGDMEEMDKLIHRLDTLSHSSPGYYHLKQGRNSSGMLNAVLDVGDAIADLVQATAEHQQK